MKRREFLKLSAKLGALALLPAAGIGCSRSKKAADAIALPALPYEINALEPHISAKTVSLHYGKHHQGYVKKINALIANTPYEKMTLADIIRQSKGKAGETAIFNNAAQVFNHSFYWNSMKPGGSRPSPALAQKISADFGSYDAFAREFSDAAASQFGSGWAWLLDDSGKLKIMKTANADTPAAQGLRPLLCIDVWEHAYYPDYQNRRGDYIQAYLEHLINWEFAEKNLGK